MTPDAAGSPGPIRRFSDALRIGRMRRELLPGCSGTYSVLHAAGRIAPWAMPVESPAGPVVVDATRRIVIVQDTGAEISLGLTPEGVEIEAFYRVPRIATPGGLAGGPFPEPFAGTLIRLRREVMPWNEVLDPGKPGDHGSGARSGQDRRPDGGVQVHEPVQPHCAPARTQGAPVPRAHPRHRARAGAQPVRRQSRPARADSLFCTRKSAGSAVPNPFRTRQDGRTHHDRNTDPDHRLRAGCTAAIYAARAGLDPVMLEGLQPGGQLTITDEVENYPPFASTTGPGLMVEMKDHVTAAGTDIRSRIADGIVRDDVTGTFTATLDDGSVIEAETVVLATGAKAKWLGIPSETAFMGRGVSACATCDGFFYRGKEVLVVGGGNTAVEEALYLSNLASRVTVIHRRDSFRAEKILQDRLFSRDNIDVMWNSEIHEILGDEMGVTGARVTSGDASVEVSAHGVFVAIGHAPETSIVAGLVDRDQSGYVLVKPGATITSCPGIFAAGDVSDPVYRQAITSAGFGCMAALDAEKYLAARRADQS